MEPIKEQHDAATRGSLHKIAVALAHLWLTTCYLLQKVLPRKHTFWVYDTHLEWGREVLRGKRIKVTIEVEDWNP